MIRQILVLQFLFVLIVAIIASCQSKGDYDMNSKSDKGNINIAFATYAETEEQFRHVRFLAESIRQFTGKMKEAPIYVYVPENSDLDIIKFEKELKPLGVEVKLSQTPEDALWFYYAGKTFAAGVAETVLAGKADILVWMDDDTIILEEPLEFYLDSGISLAYRPVMHNRSGTLYNAEPDAFWSRIYDNLKIKNEDLFAMTTPADKQKIKAYFNAGLIVVRPERGILRKWGEDFKILYQDTVLAKMCQTDIDKRIFLRSLRQFKKRSSGLAN